MSLKLWETVNANFYYARMVKYWGIVTECEHPIQLNLRCLSGMGILTSIRNTKRNKVSLIYMILGCNFLDLWAKAMFTIYSYRTEYI